MTYTLFLCESQKRFKCKVGYDCAMKQAVEHLWKKRFGLVESDDFKVIKRRYVIYE